jgi:hypothetical protein
METEQPPTCPLCAKEFGSKWALWLHVGQKYVVSCIKWTPRRIGRLVLPQHVFKEHVLDGTTPVGFISQRGKRIAYGEQYRKLYFWGRI